MGLGRIALDLVKSVGKVLTMDTTNKVGRRPAVGDVVELLNPRGVLGTVEEAGNTGFTVTTERDGVWLCFYSQQDDELGWRWPDSVDGSDREERLFTGPRTELVR